MGIEAHCIAIENPYEPARIAFEELVTELSSLDSQRLTNSELETLINHDGFEIMRLLLQGHLEERGPNEALSPVVNSAGTVLPHKRERGRWLESIFGRVWVNRIGYEAKGESVLCPLDGNLNLPKEFYSLGVRKRVASEAVKNSFDEVVAAVSTTTGALPNVSQSNSWPVLPLTSKPFIIKTQKSETPKKMLPFWS